MRLSLMAVSVLSAFFLQACFVEAQGTKPLGKDHSISLHSHPNAPPIVLPQRYQQAVKNAIDATEADVSRDLTPILQANDNLVRRGQGDDLEVLVVTWTSSAAFYPKAGTTYQEKYPVWVTAAPQLKNFCVAYKPNNSEPPLARRLEQLLGLPPNSGHKYVIELWVKPKDLYRPSADPEVTDYEAQLRFPDVRDFVSVTQGYKDWYNSTAAARYQPSTGPAYPWTRLGYTYDWGNPQTRVGLSEFVIREGAELTVHSVSTTEDYGKAK